MHTAAVATITETSSISHCSEAVCAASFVHSQPLFRSTPSWNLSLKLSSTPKARSVDRPARVSSKDPNMGLFVMRWNRVASTMVARWYRHSRQKRGRTRTTARATHGTDARMINTEPHALKVMMATASSIDPSATSITSWSSPKRFSSRPEGVDSKKDIGHWTRLWRTAPWIRVAALALERAQTMRESTIRDTPSARTAAQAPR
mmetsp:Transcript_25957/g.77522  ORF Transcript_25957/g.77522 Transcript_25957/m.77522 type:complete len:204 (-) Transcript_25957:160-771(-)